LGLFNTYYKRLEFLIVVERQPIFTKKRRFFMPVFRMAVFLCHAIARIR